jgi:hypothetical protein
MNRPVLLRKAVPITTIPILVPPQYLQGGPILRSRRGLMLRDSMVFLLTSNTRVYLV